MIARLVIAALCGLLLQACEAGPHLGAATNVVIAETGNDDPSDSAGECLDFKLSDSQARAFLNRASIVTSYEIHDSFNWFPCYVRGTAEFRGLPATWEIRAGGTGTVTILSEFIYLLGDPEQRDEQE